MADKNLRWEDNVPGKYYVDRTCIASKVCVAVAPGHFRMSETGYAYVHKQPQTREEEDVCREAFLGCPVEAIGDDGSTDNGGR